MFINKAFKKEDSVLEINKISQELINAKTRQEIDLKIVLVFVSLKFIKQNLSFL